MPPVEGVGFGEGVKEGAGEGVLGNQLIEELRLIGDIGLPETRDIGLFCKRAL